MWTWFFGCVAFDSAIKKSILSQFAKNVCASNFGSTKTGRGGWRERFAGGGNGSREGEGTVAAGPGTVGTRKGTAWVHKCKPLSTHLTYKWNHNNIFFHGNICYSQFATVTKVRYSGNNVT